MTHVDRIKTTFHELLWESDLVSFPWWKASVIWLFRTVYVLIRDFLDGQLTLRAMSLVYTTLLALVPLIAVSFSVLKAFGVHNQAEPLLLQFLEPLGGQSIEAADWIIGFVDNVKVGVLGSLGIALLIYATVTMIQKVEAAFNYAWRVERSRSFSKRFSSYLTVILIGPVLVFTALGVTATLMSTSVVQALVAIEPFGSLYRLISQLVPYLLIIGAFTFFYIFIPNTPVRFHAALTGGVVAGILWNITGKLFAMFVVQSAKYTAIYSGFAVVLLFMIWVYLSWLIMLVGASIAFYQQHPEYLIASRRDNALSNRMREQLSLLLMTYIGQNYYHDRPAWTSDTLAHRLHISAQAVSKMLHDLEEGGLLLRTDAEPPTFVPARPLDITTVKQVLEIVRSANEGFRFDVKPNAATNAIGEIFDNLDHAMEEVLQGRTLKDLAMVEPPPVVSSIESFQQHNASAAHSSDS